MRRGVEVEPFCGRRPGPPACAGFACWGGESAGEIPSEAEGTLQNPDAARCDHATSGSSLETPVLTFSAVRDGFYYKFRVYILVSRNGPLYISIAGYFDRSISHTLNWNACRFGKRQRCGVKGDL